MRRALVLLGVLLIVPSEARADEIRLKNGSVLQGKIVREDKDVVVIDLGRGRMNIARRDITTVRRIAEPAENKPGDSNNKRNGRDPDDHSRDAVPPPGGGIPRTPAVPVLRKKKERGSASTPGAGPKVVPVERTPPPAGKSTGPDAGAPSRKTAKSSPKSSGSQGSRAASAKPDW